jgi:hypothetical protein
MISNEPSRMYAALRCIEGELEKEKPSIAAIRAIILEAGRELRPTQRAVDLPCCCAEIESAGVFNPDCPRHGLIRANR